MVAGRRARRPLARPRSPPHGRARRPRRGAGARSPTSAPPSRDRAEVGDQRGLKAVSQRIFERTFAVTVALNGLTLAVAGIALLTSLLTLSDARLARLAPLWAVGVTRRRLALIELGQALGLAALTAARRAAPRPRGSPGSSPPSSTSAPSAGASRSCSSPAGGRPSSPSRSLTAALAAAWPALRLRRASPLRLLQSFSNER